MEVAWLDQSQHQFPGYFLILPSVSTANVGQLALDILITSLNAEQIAIVHHPFLLPLVGSNAYQDTATGLTTSADLHVCHKYKLLLLQIRAPHAKGCRREFIHALTQFVSELLSSDQADNSVVMVLAGCQAASRTDKQLVGDQLRYYPSEKFLAAKHFNSLRNIGPPQLEEVEDLNGQKIPFLPGAGYTRQLTEMSPIASVALLMFVNEGDNTSDAIGLASYAWQAVGADDAEGSVSWRVPSSWKNMFGAPAPRSLFL